MSDNLKGKWKAGCSVAAVAVELKDGKIDLDFDWDMNDGSWGGFKLSGDYVLKDENNAEVNVLSGHKKGEKFNIRYDPKKNKWKFVEDVSSWDYYFSNGYEPAEFDKVCAQSLRKKL